LKKSIQLPENEGDQFALQILEINGFPSDESIFGMTSCCKLDPTKATGVSKSHERVAIC
jgi:hypothetical protein